MKYIKILTATCIFVTLTIYTHAQNFLYAAAKAGLNMREKDDASSPIVTKIPYGSKITFLKLSPTSSFKSEGMETSWIYVSFGTLKGYVADIYTLPIAPPNTPGSLQEYAKQLAKPIATWTSPKQITDGEGASDEVNKTLYSNGVIYRSGSYYESSEETIYIEDLTMQKAFVLARLLSNVPTLLNTNDPFPVKSIEASTSNSKIVQILKYANWPVPQTIRIEICNDACDWVVIRQDEGVTCITFGSGV